MDRRRRQLQDRAGEQLAEQPVEVEGAVVLETRDDPGEQRAVVAGRDDARRPGRDLDRRPAQLPQAAGAHAPPGAVAAGAGRAEQEVGRGVE